MNYALRGMSLLETSSLQCGHTGLPYLYMYIHAGVATETFASASDTSESTYGIEHIEVKDMHLYILCRCVVSDGYNYIREGLLRGLYDLC